jgi:hypothetical protein
MSTTRNMATSSVVVNSEVEDCLGDLSQIVETLGYDLNVAVEDALTEIARLAPAQLDAITDRLEYLTNLAAQLQAVAYNLLVD